MTFKDFKDRGHMDIDDYINSLQKNIDEQKIRIETLSSKIEDLQRSRETLLKKIWILEHKIVKGVN